MRNKYTLLYIDTWKNWIKSSGQRVIYKITNGDPSHCLFGTLFFFFNGRQGIYET